MTNVKPLISAAYSQALIHHQETLKIWCKASHIIGGGLLPDSELVVSIQRIGNTDVLLRCMEEETAAEISQLQFATDVDLALHYQIMLSEAWVCECYEVFRLLKSRNLLRQNKAFENLAHDLRLLRIPIAKHEIANDRKLSTPLKMYKLSVQGNVTGSYDYSSSDSQKAHIMGKKMSERGSVTWDAIDVASGESCWLERLSLSKRIVTFCDSDIQDLWKVTAEADLENDKIS